MAKKKKLTKTKAQLILHEGMVHGHQLTERQRKFFGVRASGSPLKKTVKRAKKRRNYSY